MSHPIGGTKPIPRHQTSEIIRLLREIRIERGITLLNLGIDIDIDESNLARIERGVDEPKILTIERWAKSLGYELDLHRIES